VQRAMVRITNLTHTYDGDLIISFKGTSTPLVALSSNNGAGSDNYINTTFDDVCATPISSGSPPFSGCFIPDEPLSGVNNTPVSTTWTLQVEDTAFIDTGTLNSWAVAFCVSP
jgi:subtilisin-like proprotein convertase family protein